MTEEEKKKEILNFLYENVFKPMLKYAKENNDKKINRVVNDTMYNIKLKDTARKMVTYYNDIIEHKTLSSKSFYEYLNQKGINTKLEDIKEEFNKRFNEEWLNS